MTLGQILGSLDYPSAITINGGIYPFDVAGNKIYLPSAGTKSNDTDLAAIYHQRFQVATNLRLGGERHDLCQVGRSALIKVVKLLRLLEIHCKQRVALDLVENPLQLGPVLPFLGQEPSHVDDHF